MCLLHHHKISIFVSSCAFGLETYLVWQISYTCFSLDAICWTSLTHSLWAERGLLAPSYGSCFNPSRYLRLLIGELGPLLISEDLQHQKTNVNYSLVFFPPCEICLLFYRFWGFLGFFSPCIFCFLSQSLDSCCMVTVSWYLPPHHPLSSCSLVILFSLHTFNPFPLFPFPSRDGSSSPISMLFVVEPAQIFLKLWFSSTCVKASSVILSPCSLSMLSNMHVSIELFGSFLEFQSVPAFVDSGSPWAFWNSLLSFSL